VDTRWEYASTPDDNHKIWRNKREMKFRFREQYYMGQHVCRQHTSFSSNREHICEKRGRKREKLQRHSDNPLIPLEISNNCTDSFPHVLQNWTHLNQSAGVDSRQRRLEGAGVGASSKPSLSITNARSKITRPSLYRCVSSVAYSYIQPSLVLQFLHATSRTMCRPVSITRSCTPLYTKFTTCNRERQKLLQLTRRLVQHAHAVVDRSSVFQNKDYYM